MSSVMRGEVRHSRELGALFPTPTTVRFGTSARGFKASSSELEGFVSRSCTPIRRVMPNDEVIDGWRKWPLIRQVFPWRARASERLVATAVLPSPGSAEVIKMVCTGEPFGESGIRMLVSRFRIASASGEFGFSVRNFNPLIRIAAIDLAAGTIRVGLPFVSKPLVPGTEI